MSLLIFRGTENFHFLLRDNPHVDLGPGSLSNRHCPECPTDTVRPNSCNLKRHWSENWDNPIFPDPYFSIFWAMIGKTGFPKNVALLSSSAVL